MTIFALSTPPGIAGVAVLRISGPEAMDAVRHLGVKKNLTPRLMHLCRLHHPKTQSLLDRAMIVYFPAPHSFTGEEVVELHLHGSPAILQQVMESLSLHAKLRPAEPGEFTRQAFINQKMDLAEAEGLNDLIHAETAKQAELALEQMSGKMSDQYEEWREQLLHTLSLIEAYIDFPEEEIPSSVMHEVEEKIEGLLQSFRQCLDDNHIGERIREGLNVTIIGPPNAGKSTLINYLAKRDVAIVSDIQGTTRDVLEVQLNIEGYLVNVADTAGLRESDDEVEQLGIARARKKAGESDLCILLQDATQPQAEDGFTENVNVPLIRCYNKIDLLREEAPATADYALSFKTGEGVDAFMGGLMAQVKERYGSQHSPLITRTRHRKAIMRALETLEKRAPLDYIELACEDIRIAAEAIGQLTGKIHVEEILGEIFSQFCIGK